MNSRIQTNGLRDLLCMPETQQHNIGCTISELNISIPLDSFMPDTLIYGIREVLELQDIVLSVTRVKATLQCYVSIPACGVRDIATVAQQYTDSMAVFVASIRKEYNE